MVDFIINFFVVVLILVSIFAILVVLMQRNSTQAGMGAALGGGGPAEQAFGAETTTVLTRATQTTTIIFFVLSFVLYLAFQAKYEPEGAEGTNLLPDALALEESAETSGETEVVVEPVTEAAPTDADALTSEDADAEGGAEASEPNP